MKYLLISTVLLFVSLSSHGQKKEEYYDLNYSLDALYNKTIIGEYNYLPSAEGTILMEYDTLKFNGVINKFFFNNKQSDAVTRKGFTRHYISRYSDLQMTLFNETSDESEISPLSGLSIEYFKKNGQYEVKNIEKYSDSIKKELKEELESINSRPRRHKYLKRVKLNQLIQLDKQKIYEMLGGFGKIEDAEGTMKIVKVSNEKNDKMATIEVAFKVNILDEDDEGVALRFTFNFEGIIKRSLLLNIDLETDLEGTIHAVGEIQFDDGSKGKMTLFSSGKLLMTNKLETP